MSPGENQSTPCNAECCITVITAVLKSIPLSAWEHFAREAESGILFSDLTNLCFSLQFKRFLLKFKLLCSDFINFISIQFNVDFHLDNKCYW